MHQGVENTLTQRDRKHLSLGVAFSGIQEVSFYTNRMINQVSFEFHQLYI